MTSDLQVHILLVEDEPDLRHTLAYNLKREGYKVIQAQNGEEGYQLLVANQNQPIEERLEVVISDVMMPKMNGFELAKAMRAMNVFAETPLIFLTAKDNKESKMEGFEIGADDYISKPFDVDELLLRVKVQVRRAVASRNVQQLILKSSESQEVETSNEQNLQAQKPMLSGQSKKRLYEKVKIWEERFPALAAIREEKVVGQSEEMLSLLRDILLRVKGSDPVLISGESGSGKTGVAEAIHALGERETKKFRAINCAELVASDAALTLGKLFGFGKNSALANIPKEGMPGLLDDCDGGVLFLDEIHLLPTDAQSMLLLPLEGRAFNVAAGRAEPKTVDIKFIFATNKDLKIEAEEGRFPFDLYQRLAVSQIVVPPLRDRKSDILSLAEYFLKQSSDDFDLKNAHFTLQTKNILENYKWPGNVRELRHAVRELCRQAEFECENILRAEYLPKDILETAGSITFKNDDDSYEDEVVDILSTAIKREEDKLWNALELEEILVLRSFAFKISKAEKHLGLSTKSRTLSNHLRGFCFKALVATSFSDEASSVLVCGEEQGIVYDRLLERIKAYVEMVQKHVDQYTTKTLFNNLPKDYRQDLETVIEHLRRK